MKRSIIQALAICFFVLSLPICVSAQNLGDIGNIGGGNTGNGNTGNGSTGSGSSINNSGGSSGGTEFGSTVDTPTFQDFEGIGSQIFIGRDSSIPFIGREEAFGDRKTTTNNKRTVTPTTTRRSTSRVSSNRTTSGRSVSSSNNGRSVRAAATMDFAFSPMEVSNRTAEFQNRLSRLPNLSVVPEQIDIKFESSPLGNVATLTGSVPSERERKVMKQLLLLEPGIDKVENKLTVGEIQHE